MTPASEVYRFGNGGLLTSTERVTVPVVLADHPLLLSYSVVESPVLSLLIGRDVVVKVLVWTSRVAAKPWNTMVDHNHWKIRLLDTLV